MLYLVAFPRCATRAIDRVPSNPLMRSDHGGAEEAVQSRPSADAHHRQHSIEEDGLIERHVPSLALLAFLGIALNMEYSVLMPTVWGYVSSIKGGNKLYLGYAISSFSISRMACFFAVGYWTDKRPMREVFVVTCLLGIIGNALYGEEAALPKQSLACHV